MKEKLIININDNVNIVQQSYYYEENFDPLTNMCLKINNFSNF